LSASDVKAAYLYQFGQYIESPRSDTLTVCVAGDNAIATALEKLAKADGTASKTVVRRDAGTALAAGGCGILFVGHDEAHAVAALLKVLGNAPTLVVGEDAPFLRAGGMVAFILQDRKVRFSVSLANTAAAHVKLSSQLLKHAVEVIQ
jgi:hypothetical protein